MSQFFFNQRASLVNDVIEGTIIASPWNNLARLESDPAIRVVVRRDLNKNNVAVISGGGAGHEPAHVGFIGKGMLTAAVCGDLFASPSVDAVLTAIQAVTGEAGCLLIVKNYTGDRLNFGLAAEKARRLGYNVEMLIVGDDISLPDNKQPRGIAGTILVHKVAGYFAERGFNLATVLREAQYAASHTASIGVALASCHLPQEADSAPRHQAGHAELGMGIHGEPGASTIATQNSAEIVNLMVEKLTAALIDLEEHLNALDAKVGDGDTGSTFAAGAREIAERLERQQLPLNDLPTLFALIGERLTVVMGGSSGVLMSIFFTAAGQKLGQGASVAEALNAGLEQMKFYGGADEGDRTMIDALQPALAALLAEPENLQAAFAAAQAGADRTCQSSKAGAGRASYLNSDSLLGNMDPGAHAVAMVFKALAER
ncbi:TPA: dihydroxyacetone kinase subunit DhaK [Klebsiella pneumoniae]